MVKKTINFGTLTQVSCLIFLLKTKEKLCNCGKRHLKKEGSLQIPDSHFEKKILKIST